VTWKLNRVTDTPAIDARALPGPALSSHSRQGELAFECAPCPLPTLPPVQAKPYLSVQLKATATRPRLEFDRAEVVLPPVPLGHVARSSFYVLNQGYDNLELQVRLE
jgi:hypothetical protein